MPRYIPFEQMTKLREAARNGDEMAKKILRAQLDDTEDFSSELDEYFKPKEEVKVEEVANKPQEEIKQEEIINEYDKEDDEWLVVGDSFNEFRKKLSPMRSIDHAGEVAEYMLILSLNDLGEAFLKVNEFVSRNQAYAGTRPKGEPDT